LVAEFTNEPRYLDLVLNQLRVEGIQLDRLAGTFLPLFSGGRTFALLYGGRLITEYHRFFNPITQEVRALPTRLVGSESRFTMDEVLDHPSEFVRRRGSFGLGITSADCIEAFLRRVAVQTDGSDAGSGEAQNAGCGQSAKRSARVQEPD